MKTPTRLPASSFDPRFRDFLLRGARERVEVPCETHNQAVKLRHQMSIYRAAMKKENNEGWQQMYRAVLRIARGSNVLVLEPKGMEFDSALNAATVSGETAAPPAAPTGLEGLLEDLKKEQSDG